MSLCVGCVGCVRRSVSPVRRVDYEVFLTRLCQEGSLCHTGLVTSDTNMSTRHTTLSLLLLLLFLVLLLWLLLRLLLLLILFLLMLLLLPLLQREK